MTTSVSLQSEHQPAMSIPVLKELATKMETLRRMVEKVTGPSDTKKRIKDLITEAINLLDISIRDSEGQFREDSLARDNQRMDTTLQNVLDKTLDRLMHVERRASTAEAENKLIKDECERLVGHLKQQDQILENVQKLYREARDCSDRNATSAKEWRARAQELESELTNKKGTSGEHEKIMARLRALYIRYTELAARMKEREAEFKAKEECHRMELASQSNFSNEKIGLLEREISGLKRQIDLLKRLERSPATTNTEYSREQQQLVHSSPNNHMREDSDQPAGMIYVRKPLSRLDSIQQSDKDKKLVEAMDSTSLIEDIDLQTMQQIQETMDKNYPRVFLGKNNLQIKSDNLSSKRPRSAESNKIWKDVVSRDRNVNDPGLPRERKAISRNRGSFKPGQYERSEALQALLKSTSVYDLVEPSTNTTRVMPSESSAQEPDYPTVDLCNASTYLQNSRPDEEADLHKSKSHVVLADLLQHLRQTEERMMSADLPDHETD